MDMLLSGGAVIGDGHLTCGKEWPKVDRGQ
jgi:hypothetical protein